MGNGVTSGELPSSVFECGAVRDIMVRFRHHSAKPRRHFRKTCSTRLPRFLVCRCQGNQYDMGQFKGKVMVVCNVASKCGFTGQYAGLIRMHQELKAKGLVVMCFPCDQFLRQEFRREERVPDPILLP